MQRAHLLPRNRILQQHQVRQPGEIPQRVEIRQLRHVVRRQHQGRQVRYGRGQVRRDVIDAVARKQQGPQAGEIREVRQGRDVVIREVDGILVLQDLARTSFLDGQGYTHLRDTQILNGRNLMT